MNEVEILATFDTVETATTVAKTVNLWFSYLFEEKSLEDAPEIFEDFGISLEDYALDPESDIDWGELPIAKANSNNVSIEIDSANTIDSIEELLEAMGAYEVSVVEDEN